jgi:energy-coupling factor transporter ATP-binding protein EcfA2
MVTATHPITNKDRFLTSDSPCPICHGWDRMKRGHGERCSGYRSAEYVFCTREEYRGTLEPAGNTTPPAYKHKLHGPCNCGVQHAPALSLVPKRNTTSQDRRIVKEYTYYTADGKVAYQAVRYEPKDFNQRRPGPDGKWIWNMQGVEYVLYHLPELLKASLDILAYIVEGEKDADNLKHHGLLATTNVGGAGKWHEEYNQYFKGRHVVILPDNDDKGRDHAEKVKAALTGIAASIKIVTLPNLEPKGDVSDWLASGGTTEELERLSKPQKRKFTYASEIEEQPVEWLWKRRIAKGCFTLMVGDPGLGKSTIISKIAEAVTTGKGLPDGGKIEPGGVILMSPEDSASRTIVPRLRAAGVNLKKVLLLSEIEDFDSNGEAYMRPVSFPEDAPILQEAIEDARASLAIIDPVLSMLNSKVDAHKDHAVRQALTRVISVAEKHNCALLGIAHLNKGQSPNALYRSSSSIAFIAMARTGLFVVPDPDSESGGVIVNHKNNLAPKAMSLRYGFRQTEDEIGYITWEGESTYTESELISQSSPTNNKRSEQIDDLVSILKENGEAMTPEEILPYTHTGQTLSALKMMLSRKVDSEVMRVARGKYTYIGNPKYLVTVVNSDVNVNNVTNVKNTEKDESNICNINNMPFRQETEKLQPLSQNGHKSARHAWGDFKEEQDERGFYLYCQEVGCFNLNVHGGTAVCDTHWKCEV